MSVLVKQLYIGKKKKIEVYWTWYAVKHLEHLKMFT